MTKNKWNKVDEQYLIENYINKSKEELVDGLSTKRTWISINKKANSLGLYKNLPKQIDEEEFIRDYNNGMSYIDMMKKYNYTNKTNLFPKIKKLGLQPRAKRWTTEQINYLMNNYAYEEWDNLLINLKSFKKEDIITKAYKLGIKRECYGYSESEINILKENYGKVTFDEIRKLIPNKTDAFIMKKASELGLVMREKWTQEEIDLLTNLYSEYNNDELVN